MRELCGHSVSLQTSMASSVGALTRQSGSGTLTSRPLSSQQTSLVARGQQLGGEEGAGRRGRSREERKGQGGEEGAGRRGRGREERKGQGGEEGAGRRGRGREERKEQGGEEGAGEIIGESA